MKVSFLTTCWAGFSGLFYPNVCLCCSDGLLRGERYVCVHCLSDLPATHFQKQRDNPVEQMFWGRAKIEYATAGFFFRKGNHVQKLIHNLKYKGQKELGEYLGLILGKSMKGTVFEAIDMVVPVPLHSSKLRKRGYNQSEWIAKGICAELGKPLNTGVLVRQRSATSQTRQLSYDRWRNVAEGFGLSSTEAFAGKHVLLIDDVITTGATLEACINAVMQSPDVRVSIAAMAMASY